MVKRKSLKLAAILAASALALCLPIGIITSKGLDASTYMIDIGSSGNSIRIAQISDLHYPQHGVPLQTVIQQTQQAAPDLIFFTGDLVDSDADSSDINALEAFIQSITAIAPVYAVSGNHELDLKYLRQFKSLLKDNNITYLSNTALQINIKSASIGIVGIEDNEGYEKAILGIQKLDKGIPIILLAHRPEKWQSYLSQQLPTPIVTFSGHAHGGQIRLFGKGVFSHGNGLFPKYTSGIYTSNNSYLVVSRGLGNSNMPLRVFNKYHLPIVTLNL